jgi:hypothetical protein
MIVQNGIGGDLGVTYGAPSKAVLNSHDDITADAVRPVPTLLFATINVSVVLLSSPNDFLSSFVTPTCLPGE